MFQTRCFFWRTCVVRPRMYKKLKLAEAGEKEEHDIGEDIIVGTSAGFKTLRKHKASQLVEAGR